jgi:hypothetical protein
MEETKRKRGRPLGTTKDKKRLKKVTICLEEQDFKMLLERAYRERRKFTAMAGIIVEDALREGGIPLTIEGII